MVVETEFYDLLEIQTDASDIQIKKAYRKLALKFHPDHNPNNPAAAEKFKQVTEAYEVLSSEEKRKLYDRHGKEALKDGGAGSRAHDIFSQLFGNFSRGNRVKKTEDVVKEFPVSLEDLYKGKTSKISILRNIICNQCKGKGLKNNGNSVRCRVCSGRGITLAFHSLGPGMVQQMQTICTECNGTGQYIKPSDRCKDCNGKKVVKEKKAFEVYISKGMRHQQKIVFSGEADQEPGFEPGDIILVLDQKEHPLFRRNGNDLIIEHSIPLIQALTGCSFLITHLDGRQLLVKTSRGEVIEPGETRVIEGEGMPIPKTSENGNLLVKINIVFPKSGSLTETNMLQLEKLLPSQPTNFTANNSNNNNVEEVHLTKMTPHHQKQQQQQQYERGRREAYDEEDDEEDEIGGNHVQCAQQ
jgi:DnaJ family protein A protein 2